jgi:hypothetical protein
MTGRSDNRVRFNTTSTGNWESSQSGKKGAVIINKKDAEPLVMTRKKAQQMVDSSNVSEGKKDLLRRVLGL